MIRRFNLLPEKDSYDARCRQFVASLLLQQLAHLDIPGAHRVLGIIEADCYAAGLNFVFGEASPSGRSAVSGRLHVVDLQRFPDPESAPEKFVLKLLRQCFGFHSDVERHGGEIGGSSEPGFGSTFWFTLPETLAS